MGDVSGKINRAGKLVRAMGRRRDKVQVKQYAGAVNYNLGCGNRPLEGFVNADHYNLEFADVDIDLEKELPMPDSSVDLIWSDNVFEHVIRFRELVEEIRRVMKNGGWLVFRVPYYKCSSAYTDTTHVRFFSIGAMDAYVYGQGFDRHPLISKPFTKKDVYLEPNKARDSRLWDVIDAYAQRYPYRYENGLVGAMFPFEAITFALKK